MIFKPEMVEKILAGHKTVTRRPVKLEDDGYGGAIFLPCRYEAGKDYAVQPGRGKKAVARIRITSVRRGQIAGVDADEARSEGFASVMHFRRYWCRLYGLKRFDPTQLVDRIQFELLPDSPVKEGAR